jgi:hypothetical protein
MWVSPEAGEGDRKDQREPCEEGRVGSEKHQLIGQDNENTLFQLNRDLCQTQIVPLTTSARALRPRGDRENKSSYHNKAPPQERIYTQSIP